MKLRSFLLSTLLVSGLSAADLTFAIGEWPPYTGETEVDYGTTTKQVKEICTKAGLTCEFEFMPWKRAFSLTEKGTTDGTFPWESDDSYKEKFLMSPKITSTEVVAFSTKELPAGLAADYKKLAETKVVGVNGYTFPEKVKSEGIKIHMVNESKLAWKMIEKGKADTYIDDQAVGMAECKSYAPSICGNLKVSDSLLSSPMSILFTRVGQHDEAIKKFLEAMK